MSPELSHSPSIERPTRGDAGGVVARLRAVASEALHARSHSPQSNENPEGRARRRRIVRRLLIGAGVLMVLGAAVGVPLGMGMMARSPSWWRSIDPKSSATVRAGTELENRVVDVMSQIRPSAIKAGTAIAPGNAGYQSEPWSIAIRAADANAWVNARLPKWVANQGVERAGPDGEVKTSASARPRSFAWPEQVEQVQVEFARGMIHIGARVREGAAGSGERGKTRIVSASLVPELADDGSLWMHADGIGIGSLPLPPSLVLAGTSSGKLGGIPKELRELPQTERLLRAFAGDVPLTLSPTLTLGDGRRVRVLAIKPEDGLLIVTCRTERK